MNDPEVIALLTEAVRWLRFQGLEKAKAAVTEHLDSTLKRSVFDKTTGTASAREIVAATGVSLATVSNWWGEWYAAGILTKEDGKYRRLFSLAEIGLSCEESQKPKGRVNGRTR